MYPALHDDLSVTNTLQKLSIREQSLHHVRRAIFRYGILIIVMV